MKRNLAAFRYAKALLDISEEKQNSEIVYKDMNSLSKIFLESRTFVNFIENPTIASSTKKDFIKKTLKNLTSLTKKLLDLLTLNNRLSIIGQIAKSYLDLHQTNLGFFTVTVTTAFTINPHIESKVLSKIKDFTTGKINLENKIDPKILGGFIIKFKDLEYDASVKNQFKNLKSELINY
jgi:F-type H+-transporting ATPase subunit delta